MNNDIDLFLKQPAFAVAGASANRNKYGNKVVRACQQNSLLVYPMNPKEDTIEGTRAYPDLNSLPDGEIAISIVTPPAITAKVVKTAIELGAKYIWMQPGAEEPGAIKAASEASIALIHGGPCILVALGYRE